MHFSQDDGILRQLSSHSIVDVVVFFVSFTGFEIMSSPFPVDVICFHKEAQTSIVRSAKWYTPPIYKAVGLLYLIWNY